MQGQSATFLSWLDRQFGHVAAWSATHQKIVLLCTVLLAIGGVYFASKTHADNGLNSFFDDDDPTYQFYIEYQQEFYSDETIYLLYHAPDTEYGPFDIEVMRTIAKLTEAIELEVPFVRKVTSLANTEFVEATGDLIEIHDLFYGFPEHQDELVKLRNIALSKPVYVGNLISRDGEYGAIVADMTKTSTDVLEDIRLDPDGGDGLENLYPQAANNALNEILRRPEYSGIKFYISGDVPFNAVYNERIVFDTPIITFGTLVLIALVAVLLFPTRLSGLIAPLTVVLITIAVTVGFIGLMGWSLGMMFMMVPTLICAIGVSQTVHVMLAYQRARLRVDLPSGAARMAIEEVGTPCLLAALTTAIGLLGMTTSSLQGISEMAFYAGFGVIAAFVLSVTLMVSYSALTKPESLGNAEPQSKPAIRIIERALEKAVAVNLEHPKGVMVVSGLIFVFSLVGISTLRVDFNMLEDFKPHVEMRRNIEKAEEIMGGWTSAVYIFDTGEADGINNAEMLRLIEGFTEYAESKALVKKSQHIIEIIKDLNQALHEDDPEWYRLPDDHEAMAQLLFLYQMSGGEEINDYINFDASQTVVQLRIRVSDSSVVRELLDDLDAYLEARPVAGVEIKKTGIGVLWVRILEYIGTSQMQGYSVVFLLIFGFICMVYGSVKIGVLAMIANLTPIVFILGCMGFADINLDSFRLLLATIAIGIAVDDTIHLLNRYKVEFARNGDYRVSLEHALMGVGPALITTTIILIVAFLTYLWSDLAVLASFGLLLSGAVLAALIADLFLLPVLIMIFQPFGPEKAATRTIGN